VEALNDGLAQVLQVVFKGKQGFTPHHKGHITSTKGTVALIDT